VISGWLDNRYFAKWVRSGVNSLLTHGDYNVIYVAWKSIQELFVAAFIIKLFSEDLTHFIVFLKVFFIQILIKTINKKNSLICVINEL
jgi:hypothetical protein